MAIKFTKYINITSGVGGTALVANRELIARVFTDNVLSPRNILEFTNASDVGTYRRVRRIRRWTSIVSIFIVRSYMNDIYR